MRNQKNHSLWFMFCAAVLIQCSTTQASFFEAAAHNVIRTATTITASGPYRITEEISGQITISANDVTLDLNNHTITGGTHCIAISSNQSNITISNGTLKSASSHGIDFAANCSKISLTNLSIDQCNRGIYATTATHLLIKKCLCTNNTNEGIKLTSCTNCDISSCSSRSNKVGFFLDQTNTTHITDTVATSCTLEGFQLSSAQKNILQHCRALNIGTTNTGDSFGFSTNNGSENSFLQCVAEGITTTATAESNVVAGFALKGTEQASAIISCTVSDVQTSTSNQVVPYGIFAEITLPTPVLKQSIAWGANVKRIRWAPNGYLFALASNAAEGTSDVGMYRFDRKTETATAVATAFTDTDKGLGASWSRTGERLAVSTRIITETSGDSVMVYDVDPESGELSLAASHTPADAGSLDHMEQVTWAPNGRLLLAIGRSMNPNDLFLYYFDPNTNSLTLRQSIDISNGWGFHWSPTHNFVAVANNLSTKQVRLYEYDAKSNLTERDTKDHGANVRSVWWSPDGTYLAAGGHPGTGGFHLRIYEFDVTAKTLILRDSVVEGTRVRGIDWSPDGKYVLTGNNSDRAYIYSFSHTTKTLTLEHTLASHGANIADVSWAPDGKYILFGGDASTGITHRIYSALASPEKCVVRGNLVHNIKGAVGNRGVGINVPSVDNLVAKNITHDNDHDYRNNTRLSYKLDPEELLNFTG